MDLSKCLFLCFNSKRSTPVFLQIEHNWLEDFFDILKKSIYFFRIDISILLIQFRKLFCYFS